MFQIVIKYGDDTDGEAVGIMGQLIEYSFPNGMISLTDVTGKLPMDCRLPVSYAKAVMYKLPEGKLLIQRYTHLLFYIEVLEFNLRSELHARYAMSLSNLFLFCMLQGGIKFHTTDGKPIYQALKNTCYGTFNQTGKYGYRLGSGVHQVFFMIPNAELIKANPAEYPELLKLLEDMEKGHDSYGHMPECPMEGKIFRLMALLLDYRPKPGKDMEIILFTRGKALLQEYHRMVTQKLNRLAYRARSYLEYHYAESELSNTNIANAFKISKRTLSRIFNAKFKISPYAYLINIRLEKARTLLNEQKLPVNEVYPLVGYKDQRSFRSQFHKKFGYPPSDSY